MSKNVYIDKLDDMVHEYNNTYHNTIKLKLLDVKSNTYIDFDAEKSDKDPKFKVHKHLRTSKYRKIFAKGYTFFFYIRKPFFCLSLNFLNIMLEIRLRFS